MAAFKETGGIEYSADVLLGLQSSFAESETEQNDGSKRQVEIVVLKNRYGKAGEIIKFNLVTEFSCFEETENTEKTDLESGKIKTKVPRKIIFQQPKMKLQKILNQNLKKLFLLRISTTPR